MAAAGGGMAVLPQYQGNLYDLQRQQALAQALTQSAMTPQNTQAVGSGPYQIVPKYSIGGGLAQLGQALLASRYADQAAQGMQQLGQNQWAAFGGATPAQQGTVQAQQQAPSGDPVTGGANVGPMSGLSAGMGSMAPQAAPQQQQQAPQSSVMGGTATPMNPLGMNPAMAYSMYANSPDKYFETQAQVYKPADIVSQIRAAGIEPNSPLGHQLAQQALAKANYIPPTSLRPGGYAVYADGTQEQMPQVPEGYTAVRGPNGWQMVPVQGGQEAMAASAAAKAGGKAQYELKEVWDPNANNGQGGYVQQTVANVAGAAGAQQPGNIPAPLRNNNPGAMMPGGKLAQYPDMQTGLAAMDANLASYGKQGVNTLSGVVTKWAPPNENDTAAYIKDVSQRLGIPANQPVDLSNPAQRLAISTAIMLHENGSRAVFGGGGASAPATSPKIGPMSSQPGLGQTSNANAAQTASADTMKSSYSRLQSGNASANAALEALQKMQALAAGKNSVLTAGPLGTNVAPVVSPDAAEYEKQRANVIALLANQNGTNGTDAGRALTGESVPDYGKPKPAIQDGLNTLMNQVKAQQLKTSVLTPAYQAGDSKAYTKLENEFDQNISPSMVPLLSMPPGPARAAALKQAVQNPQMKSRLDWAVQNGILK